MTNQLTPSYSVFKYLRRLLHGWLLLAMCLPALMATAQPKLEFQMKKPKQFEERKLGSEKMADKKFTPIRRFFQNTYTHYNYYFNANEKLIKIIDQAIETQKDDYTELLSFFPYSLKTTAANGDIDSILQTVTTGILLHDLRNDWIDNLYLLLGKAYLHRMDFDSAMMSFQFLNTSYAPKEKDGYDQPIGSNSVEGSNAFSIATKEKTNLAKKALSRPPSRNESFLWMIRTLTAKGNYLDASSLLSTIKNDPVFPDRLKYELNEVTAYMYYGLEQYDSAAVYTEKAVANASSLHDKARRYYLTGQLYQLAGMRNEASEAYQQATKSAIDPVMEIYARLNTIRLRKSEDPNIIDQNIADLKSLAKKDSYRNYRDIIFYAIALFEVERNGYEAADNYLQTSIRFNTDNAAQRSSSFQLLGNVRYAAKKYGQAALPYDSVNTSLSKKADSLQTEMRRPGTKAVFEADEIIHLNDSLLQLALTPEPERSNAVRNIAKILRKQKGLKEELNTGGTSGATPATTADLFGNNTGTWYFYDVPRRANGFNSFREKFGDRPNVDNWRRSSSTSVTNKRATPGGQTGTFVETAGVDEKEKFDTSDISFDNLYSRLPISEERQLKTKLRINNALYKKALALHEQIEDYPEAIKYYEMVLENVDSGQLVTQSLFNLIHCYTKVGDTELANKARRLLQEKYGQSPQAKAANSNSPEQKAAAQKTTAATNAYKQVYNLFLEGKFKEATQLKQQADSSFGDNYWTPQLLYIETVYLLQSKQDSLANRQLDNIISKFADHPLAERAKLIKEVLPRRKEIEDYLSKLEVTRATEERMVVPVTTHATKPGPVTTQTQKPSQPVAPTVAPKPVKDTVSTQLVETKVEKPSRFNLLPNASQNVAIVLENIDPAYVNEVLYSINSSPRKNSPVATVTAEKKKLKDNLFLVILRSPAFTDASAAYTYIDYFKPVASKQVLTWLDAAKYRFIIINDASIEALAQDPNMAEYEQLLKQSFPGKF
ncbi:MAG: hypothetical protein LCH58_06385 [Bacteroidetes bacterium]|uniref:type IX secretion system periplasmic lipoprotein PorW/SprE n=1 Tax=Phnomibacter sp. TaxID=2836217 RepID=UPI002FDE87B9|nr:hypothetical protein [Bacteroidota bacterium]